MAIFLGVHKVPTGISVDDIQHGYEKYKKCAIEEGLKPIGAVVSIEKGFAYCQTEAASEEEVKKAHSDAGVPVEEIVMVTPLT